MALYTQVRFDVRPDALESVERALHEYASYVRAELPGTMFTAYRDADVPTRYLVLVRDATVAAVKRAPARSVDDVVQAYLVGSIERMPCELVTSSDLAPRPRAPGRRAPRRRS